MSVLFEPLQIGKLNVNNRFLRSATYFGLADDAGCVGEPSADLMRRLAVNQVGLIVTGYAYVSRHGRCFSDMNGIDNDAQIDGYKRMTEAVHEEGGTIVMQIAHGGSAANAAIAEGFPRMVVSARPGATGTDVREMTDEDIEGIIEDFGTAAARVQEAGFDGVQIHGAHGYLVTQFLSPFLNQRSDRWGASLENRSRFVVEVARSIKRHVDAGYPVMIKLGCRDYLDDGQGMTIEEGATVAKTLQDEGLCLIEVSHGVTGKDFRRLSQGKASRPIAEAYMAPDGEVISQSTSITTAVVGGMRSLDAMTNVIESNSADMIALCRPLIRQPDIIARWKNGHQEPADCVSCSACMKGNKSGGADIECREINKKQKEAVTA